MAYKDYIAQLKKEWTGQKVCFDGAEYNVVDVDYNGVLLIDKPARFTATTAVAIAQIKRKEESDGKH